MFKGAVLRYLLSDALSLIGNSIAGVVLPLVLLARTGDVLAAGSLALICAVPQFVCGVVGGAVLDRVNRRTVSVVADLISAASCALLPVVDEVWGLSFGWFVVLGLLGAVIAFFLQWALYACPRATPCCRPSASARAPICSGLWERASRLAPW